MMEMNTENINELFFRQIKRLSVESVKPNLVHAFSTSVPDEPEVSFC